MPLMATTPSVCHSSKLELVLSVCYMPATLSNSRWANRKSRHSSLRCCSSLFPYVSSRGDRPPDSIPKQFQEENISGSLMENYKSAPQYLYGLPSSQMEIFMNEDSLIRKKLDNMTEDSLPMPLIFNHGGMHKVSKMKDASPSMQGVSMFFKRRRKNRKKPAPDLPSSLLRARICYLGMPVFPAVSELIIAQLMYLDSVDNTKPIHFYINSTGTLDDNGQLVALENDAFAIADTMALCRAPIHTINCGVADGQAAMLLSLGTKGKRATLPNASVQLYLPKAENLSGSAADMWIQAKEVDINTEYYVELLGKGIGKSKDEVLSDISQSKHFLADEAIDYGVVDMVLDKMPSYEKPVPKKIRVRSRSRIPRRGSNGMATRPPLNGAGIKQPSRVRRVKPPSFVRLARSSEKGATAAASKDNK